MAIPTCIYTNVDPTYSSIPSLQCGKPVVLHFHGWLCKKHYWMLQQQINTSKPKVDPKQFEKIDAALIVPYEARIIQSGTTRTVRYGALEPVKIKYWEPPTVH